MELRGEGEEEMRHVEFYECDFCERRCKTESECVEHEKECDMNPDNRVCFTCANQDYLWDQNMDECIGHECKKGLVEKNGFKLHCEAWKQLK